MSTRSVDTSGQRVRCSKVADPYASTETPWRDPDKLEELYLDEGMTNHEIADELGTSAPTVGKWLDRHGIQERESINTDRPWRDEQRVRELYEDQKLTVGEVAEELECAYHTAFRWIHKHGIDTRGVREESIRGKRKKPPNHRFTRSGYEVVESSAFGSTKQVRIHRLVAVSEHGFDAVADKIVHHKNGMKSDNRPEKLEVMSQSEHARIHKPVEVRWGNKTPSESHGGCE